MTPELEAALRQAGWYPGRRVDNAKLDEWLRIGVHEYGCHLFPAAINALREYGDLVLTDGYFTHHISPEGCDWNRDEDSMLYWEWAVDEILFPLAYSMSGEAGIIAISYSGKIYSEGNGIYRMGNTIEEFLSAITTPGGQYSQSEAVVSTYFNVETDLEFERMFKAVYEFEKPPAAPVKRSWFRRLRNRLSCLFIIAL